MKVLFTMDMKKLLLMEDFAIRCHLDSDAITQRIIENSEPRKLFRSWLTCSSTPKWEGEVKGNRFSIRKIKLYDSPPYGIYFGPLLGPLLNGRIRENRVEVRVRFPLLIQSFLFFWFGSLLYLALFIFIKLMETPSIKLVHLFPFAISIVVFFMIVLMITIGYYVMSMSFKFEAENQKESLRALLEGSTEPL
jgi:hypothetical protein